MAGPGASSSSLAVCITRFASAISFIRAKRPNRERRLDLTTEESIRCIVSMAKRASPAARHTNAGVDELSTKTNEPRLPVGLILEFSFS